MDCSKDWAEIFLVVFFADPTNPLKCPKNSGVPTLNKTLIFIFLFKVHLALVQIAYCITETSPYKSDPRFPPNMGEIWGWNQNDKK